MRTSATQLSPVLRRWLDRSLLIAALLISCSHTSFAESANDDPRFSETWKKSQELRDQPAVDATPVEYIAKGKQAADRKDFDDAVVWYRKAADLGDASSMYELGQIYSGAYGYQVVKGDHFAEAVSWYQQAADHGNAPAMFWFGFYTYNEGLKKRPNDKAEADSFPWFQKSADLDYPPAITELGVLYNSDGPGIQHDHAKAAQLFLKAAQMGDAQAMNHLGYVYSHGIGVPRDLDEAVRWWKKAVAMGGDAGKAAQTWLDAIGRPRQQFGDVWKQSQVLRDQPAVDATPVEFTFLGVRYRVPRNYIVHMPGPMTPPTFRVTFPGFEPLTEKTRQCLTQPRAYWPPGCIQIDFWLEGADSPAHTDDELFNIEQKGLQAKAKAQKQGPDGFELYEQGPTDQLLQTYLKRTSTHTLLITCICLHGKQHAVCSNHRSPLPNGNSLSYWIDLNQLENAEKIDDGIRALIDSFTLKGDKP
jgi:TPR repeat protein